MGSTANMTRRSRGVAQIYSGAGSIPNDGRTADIKNLKGKLRSLLSTPEEPQRNHPSVKQM